MQQQNQDRDRNGGNPPPGSNLIDRQIEEILRNAERTHRRQLFWKQARDMAGNLIGGRSRRVTAGRLMAWGLGLCLLGVLLSAPAPALSGWIVLAGIILFLSPILLNVRSGGAFSREQRIWRGRVIEDTNDPWRDTRDWWRNLFRRRP
jgi:hypothetical protein